MASLTVGLAGCQPPVAPNQPGTTTTLSPTGVDKNTFGPAWDKLKDILVATATATSLSDFRSRVQDLRVALDAIDQGRLNGEEKQVWSRFYEVYWAYEDSVSLWSVDVEASNKDSEGIPLFRDGQPLVPRADEIVRLYGLVVKTSQTSDKVEYVPDDSVRKLWGVGSREIEKSLLPVFSR